MTRLFHFFGKTGLGGSSHVVVQPIRPNASLEYATSVLVHNSPWFEWDDIIIEEQPYYCSSKPSFSLFDLEISLCPTKSS